MRQILGNCPKMERLPGNMLVEVVERIAANQLMRMLISCFGKPPSGARLSVKSYFTNRLEYHVIYEYNSARKVEVDWIAFVMYYFPEHWDSEAESVLTTYQG